MKIIFITVLVLLILGTSTYALVQYREDVKGGPDTVLENAVVPEGEPIFLWEYSAYEIEGILHTRISLTASYPSGAAITKTIDDIEGGCNEYSELDEDVYRHSTMIICYYAGLGRYYKVIADGDGYVVQRKEFEEASPDYSPPQQEYQDIATF